MMTSDDVTRTLSMYREHHAHCLRKAAEMRKLGYLDIAALYLRDASGWRCGIESLYSIGRWGW